VDVLPVHLCLQRNVPYTDSLFLHCGTISGMAYGLQEKRGQIVCPRLLLASCVEQQSGGTSIKYSYPQLIELRFDKIVVQLVYNVDLMSYLLSPAKYKSEVPVTDRLPSIIALHLSPSSVLTSPISMP